MPDIIHVDMDCFFAAVEVKDNPKLAGKPVIVGALPGTRGVVSAASYEAREYGVHSAMPISEAYRRCPHGEFLRPNGTRYREESEAIHSIFEKYTPLVEPISVDEAFLDVSGSHRLFGDSETIGRMIKDEIHEVTKLKASVGIAPSKFLAKIASDHDKPDGFVVIYDDQVLDFLRPLPARKIWGVGKATMARLEEMGLHTIGDIEKYPLEKLAGIFGKHGRHLHNLANGIDNREVETEHERKSLGNEFTFDEDEGDMDRVERVLLALCDKVSGRLLKKNLSGIRVTLKLRDETFKTVTRARTLSCPVWASNELYEVVKELFRNEPLFGRKVRLIGVSVSGFEESNQLSLFDDEASEKSRTVDSVISSIRDKFGADAITRAALIGDDNIGRRVHHVTEEKSPEQLEGRD